MSSLNRSFSALAASYQPQIVRFAAELIRIPSYSLDERAVADRIHAEMKSLGYDDVVRDAYGNLFGILRGTGGGASVTLNCHMDIVHEGDAALWRYPPFSGIVADGRLWGRGASDTKGTLAIQLYAPIILRNAGLLPRGDTVTACVVAEESPGYGTQMQCKDSFLLTDYAILGEATENDIAIASRGRCCICIRISGRACHAAAVSGNTVFDYLERLLPALKTVPLANDPVLGRSSMNITKIESSEPGSNVVPASLTLYCDYRQVGEDTFARVSEKVQQVLNSIHMEGIHASLSVLEVPVCTYTGHTDSAVQGEPPFSSDASAPYLLRAKKALEAAVGHPVQIKCWPFATDAGHYAAKNVRVFGYSPAEASLCHTSSDSISLSAMAEATAGYLALLTTLANSEKP